MTALSLIVARSSNHAIGLNGTMPWHIPADLKFFRTTTTGFPVVMGYKTWLSIGAKPLPKRRNIVLSRTRTDIAGAEVFSTLEDALKALADEPKAFIIGGAYTYQQAMPLVTEAFITEIDQAFEGDTFFELPDESSWLSETLSTFEDGGCSGRFTRRIRK